MHTVTKPEGEARAVAKANEAFSAACKERDALPKGEQGFYRKGIDALGSDAPNANASPRYKEAQRKVSAAYNRLREVERSYFRLNIWGMGNVRRAMLDLGMCFESGYEWGAGWPAYPEDGTGAAIAAEALSEDSDPQEYAAKYYSGQEVTESDIATARAYHDQANALRRDHFGAADGIPVHKFGSNDGWIVTPNECLQALAIWHATPQSARDDAFESAGMADADWERIWKNWLAFLELAAYCDGFEVH